LQEKLNKSTADLSKSQQDYKALQQENQKMREHNTILTNEYKKLIGNTEQQEAID